MGYANAWWMRLGYRRRIARLARIMERWEMGFRRQDITMTKDERLHVKTLPCKKSKLYYYYILYSPIYNNAKQKHNSQHPNS